MATRRMSEYEDMTPSKKKPKSVFNRPMREVKKPAKKIPVKKKKPSPVDVVILDPVQDMRDKSLIEIEYLRYIINAFKTATGEQDVTRASLNQFLAALEGEINKFSEIFK